MKFIAAYLILVGSVLWASEKPNIAFTLTDNFSSSAIPSATAVIAAP